jgi:dipeptidyl aminopeptidase/acylaminoacyl peptidase
MDIIYFFYSAIKVIGLCGISAILVVSLFLSSAPQTTNNIKATDAGLSDATARVTDGKTILALTPSNGKIAFVSNRTGNGEIFTMNPDGSNQINVSNNPADDSSPAWSRDGSKIAFVRYNGSLFNIYTMNADGSNQVNLTNSAFEGSSPSWSPDGTKIVFGRESDIFLMNADGTNPTRLILNGFYDNHPSFSPDGARIVFVCSRQLTDVPQTLNDEICVMNADGSNEVNVTRNLSADAAGKFSSDGTKIDFYSNRSGQDEVYVMNADGSNPVNVSNNPAGDHTGAWAPDGTKIVFSSDRDGANNSNIYVMNTDGTNQTRLTTNPTHDNDPVWQRIAADSATVGGRVTLMGGYGIYNARITVTYAGGYARTVSTNPFGYYRFENVEVGETYTFSVSAKGRIFSQPTQVRNITGNTDDVNFSADN